MDPVGPAPRRLRLTVAVDRGQNSVVAVVLAAAQQLVARCDLAAVDRVAHLEHPAALGLHAAQRQARTAAAGDQKALRREFAAFVLLKALQSLATFALVLWPLRLSRAISRHRLLVRRRLERSSRRSIHGQYLRALPPNPAIKTGFNQ